MSLYRFLENYKGYQYTFNPVFGYLFKKKLGKNYKTETDKFYINKLKDALNSVSNPFLLVRSELHIYKPERIKKVISIYANVLVNTCQISFILAYFISKIRFPCFINSQEAIVVFRKLFPGVRQNDLCLPRTLFAAATSKNFKKSGVAFIGVFLPLKHMHAWIIEDGMNADPLDDMWICYKPVAALC